MCSTSAAALQHAASQAVMYLKATMEMTFGAPAGALPVRISSSGNEVFSTVRRSALTLYVANIAPSAVCRANNSVPSSAQERQPTQSFGCRILMPAQVNVKLVLHAAVTGCIAAYRWEKTAAICSPSWLAQNCCMDSGLFLGHPSLIEALQASTPGQQLLGNPAESNSVTRV